MRKLLGIMGIGAIILFGFLQISSLPVETKELIDRRYDGFSGVLRAWFCQDFTCKKSLIGWLNSCANDFERDHAGVYMEIESVTPEMMREYSSLGTAPDILFFSPSLCDADELRGATIVAMGGYIGICRGDAEFSIASCLLPRDGTRDYAAAAICIGNAGAKTEEIGIDLGLPAIADGTPDADAALQGLIAGEISCTVITIGQLSELLELKDSGGFSDWHVVSGDIAFTDQLLIGAATGDGERGSLAQSFIGALLAEENQLRLADYGALSPVMRVYSDLSGYAAIDAAYAADRRIMKKINSFGEDDSADIFYDLQSGRVDLAAARRSIAEKYGF